MGAIQRGNDAIKVNKLHMLLLFLSVFSFYLYPPINSSFLAFFLAGLAFY